MDMVGMTEIDTISSSTGARFSATGEAEKLLKV